MTKNSFTKEDLIACGNGELFCPGKSPFWFGQSGRESIAIYPATGSGICSKKANQPTAMYNIASQATYECHRSPDQLKQSVYNRSADL